MTDPLKANPRPSLLDLRPILQRIVNNQGCSGTCCLYACLWMHPEANECVQWSRENAARHGHADCLAACDLLERMSESQKRKARDWIESAVPEKG